MMTIGCRIPGALGKLPLADFAAWCKAEGFDAIDLGSPDPARVQTIRDAGLMVGTVDFWGNKMLAPDEATRNEGIEGGLATVNAIADAGCDKAFTVFFPPDGRQSRRDSLANWKQAFPVVAQEAERRGVRIALEGWPGPNNSALGVTPETLRLMFEAVPSPSFGINYDPSHLVRVGVDYLRFLSEFGSRVIHVHGKDTALDAEGQYVYGRLGTTLAQAPGFGDGDWRYTIPGEGSVHWPAVCALLHRAGYNGTISIELEDMRYNGSEDGEKRGLSRAKNYLLPLL